MSNPVAQSQKPPGYILSRAALREAKLGGSPHALTSEGRAGITAEQAVDWLYGILTTLDAKASALMRLNGVLIAAAAFLLGIFGREGDSGLSVTLHDAQLIIICAFLSAFSIFACLFVVQVSWRFLGKVKEAGGKFEFADEISCLAVECRKRESIYQCAWGVSAFAALGFLAEFVLQAIDLLSRS